MTRPPHSGDDRSSCPPRGDRGQTTLDFLVGVSAFLVTVGLVLTFVPGMVDPFVDDREVNPLVADRTATALAADVLGDPGDPFVVNASVADEFFDPSTDVHDRLGLDPALSVNVTLTTGEEFRHVGPEPPDGRDSVVSAWRVVSVDGVRSELRVRVW